MELYHYTKKELNDYAVHGLVRIDLLNTNHAHHREYELPMPPLSELHTPTKYWISLNSPDIVSVVIASSIPQTDRCPIDHSQLDTTQTLDSLIIDIWNTYNRSENIQIRPLYEK